MAEPPITEADLERMLRGFELFNREDFDALSEFFAPDVVMERVGDMPALEGWPAVRELFMPDAFEWQRIHPLDWEISHDKVYLHVRIDSKGAASGVELSIEGWFVWTVVDRLVVRIDTFLDEAEARRGAGLGQNAPS